MSQNACQNFIISAETIQGSPLGEELSLEQCGLLSEVVSACGLVEGSFLLEEGHIDDSIHVILKGALGVVKPTGGGDWVTLQVLHEGDLAGELGFVDGVEHSAAIRSLSNCEVFSLNRASFEALLHKDPDLVYKVMRAIIRTAHARLRRMNVQYVELTNYIAKQHGRY